MATLPDISEHLPIKAGFCHPDWAAISEIIEKSLPESGWNAGWEAASRSWLERIREKLGGGYQVHETANFMILSEAPTRVIKDACRSYEESLKRILASLEGVASDEGFGKHVVMMFASLDDYYGYITYFHPEGESPMSGGVCLGGEGYVHFAFPTTDYSSYRTVLVHELTHGCLGHLPIPAWLNEAIAMRMEQVICGSDNFHLDQEIHDRHSAHWNARTIQDFWTGESWEIPGDSFELSYNLAQVLWRKIEIDLAAPRSEILQFILDAHFEDGGEAACQAIFGLGLGDLVMDFLGEGEWSPRPDEWTNSPALPLSAAPRHQAAQRGRWQGSVGMISFNHEPAPNEAVGGRPEESVVSAMAGRSFGGIARVAFWVTMAGLAMFQHVVFGAVSPSGSGKANLVIGLVFPVIWLVPVYFRLRNIGMKPWFCLLMAVPIANAVIAFRCFVCQEGHQVTRRLDSAGKIAAGVVLGIVVVVVMELVSGGSGGFRP